MRIGIAVVLSAFWLASCAEEQQWGPCRELTETFQPCGGDRVAMWEIEDACLDDLVIDHIFFDLCQYASYSGTLDWTGRVEVTEDRLISHIEREFLDIIVVSPTNCLDSLGMTCPEFEAYLEDERSTATCTLSELSCDCELHRDLEGVWFHPDVYRLENNSFVIDEEGGFTSVVAFCIDRDLASISYTADTGDGSAIVYLQLRRM